MQHIIITRVNLHMRLDPNYCKITELWKLKGWNEERIKLLNTWARTSLLKQTNQNFTYVTLWQKGYMSNGNELNNEIKIEIQNTGTEDDEPLNYTALVNKTQGKKTLNFSNQIVTKIKNIFTGSAVITSLDCDDALHKNYVSVINEHKNNYKNYTILDMTHRYQYNINTKIKGVKSRKCPSPFFSCVEPEIKCIPIIYLHSHINDIPIKKIKQLKGLQTINNTNMYCKSTGNPYEFDLTDFV